MRSARLFLRLGVRLTSKREFDAFRPASIAPKTAICGNNVFSAFVHSGPESAEDKDEEVTRKALGTIERKLKLAFTCLKCKTRNHKIISKQAYENGVVIVRCDGCRNNHLIADNLGWFPAHQRMRNIEQILKEKGETVRRIRNDEEGYFEAVANMEMEEAVKKLTNKDEAVVNSESDSADVTANHGNNSADVTTNPGSDSADVTANLGHDSTHVTANSSSDSADITAEPGSNVNTVVSTENKNDAITGSENEAQPELQREKVGVSKT